MRKMYKNRLLILLFVFIIIFTSCEDVKNIFKDKSPHDKYKTSLEEAGLLETRMGKEWIKKSEEALIDTAVIELPYKETVFVFKDEVIAFSYRIKMERGEELFIIIETDTTNKSEIFVDLFLSNDKIERIISAEDDDTLTYTAEEDVELILRVQPALLAGGRYVLTIKKEPSLAFPVREHNTYDIGSQFGAPREAGKRIHNGVDIFAPRGTPVIAVVDGVVAGPDTNDLGGNVVKLLSEDKSFYYAHLDTLLVKPADIVNAGDTVGLVGNSGNARTTPPHLHFSIYVAGEDAIDPLPFIDNIIPLPDDIYFDKDFIGNFARIKNNNAGFYLVKNNYKTEELKQFTPFKVIGGSGGWVKAILPDDKTGYILAEDIERINKPIEEKTFTANSKVLIDLKDKNYVFQTLNKNVTFELFGKFNDSYLINYNNRFMWIGS